ncbi:unknown [Clostridium sp. CAG:354]|nr:unknown [Clostridium sp. CAG:354]
MEEKKEQKVTKYKKAKATQKTFYVSDKLNKTLINYQSEKQYTSFSETMNNILKEYFSVQANKDNITMITEILRNVIRQELNSKFERQIALEVKGLKNNLSNSYLQAKILSVLFNSDDEKEFMRNAIKEANAIGYKAIKNYDIKTDFEKLANLDKGEI